MFHFCPVYGEHLQKITKNNLGVTKVAFKKVLQKRFIEVLIENEAFVLLFIHGSGFYELCFEIEHKLFTLVQLPCKNCNNSLESKTLL
jgi:hypothetical protein